MEEQKYYEYNLNQMQFYSQCCGQCQKDKLQSCLHFIHIIASKKIITMIPKNRKQKYLHLPNIL